ncbi:MAG: NAD(P)/FAD-dependent oxidoreductase [Dehalococcoidia bacterium]
MRVGVIGGGAAGLAVGYELVRQGHQVAVFEQAPFLGGQASTFDVGGTPLEWGYHHLFMSDWDMVSFMQELGLGHRLQWLVSRAGLHYGGRNWNWSSPMDLLRFTPLSPVDRLRLGLVTLYLQRYRRWQRLEGFTATEWLQRAVGRRAYEVVWEPLLRGKFGESYAEVSMTWLWGKIYLRVASRKGLGKERLGYPMGSFGEVFDTAARFIIEGGSEVATSATVKRVVVEEGRATGLEVELLGQGPQVCPYDAIVATVPSYIFPRLVPPLLEDYLSRLTSVKYLAAVLVVLELDRPLSHIYWLNIADRSIPFVGIVEQTNFIPPEHYGGRHVVYIANYLGKEDPLYHLKAEELFQEYLPHLRKINPQFDPSWIQQYHYHREEAAQPVIGVGYSRQIPSHRTPIKGLYLANTTQVYPEDRGTNYSVRLGRKVARMVLGDYGHQVGQPLPRVVVPASLTAA